MRSRDLAAADSARVLSARWLPHRPASRRSRTVGEVLPGRRGRARRPVRGTGRGALRSGVGLVSVLTPASVGDIVAGDVPEAMVHAGASSESGSFDRDAVRAWPGDWGAFSALVIGPGLSTGDEISDVLSSVFERAVCPVLVDADGLNVLAAAPELRDALSTELVLTPHPGEMARLMGETVDGVQSDRRVWAESAARQWRAVVAHKGAGTVVAAAEKTAAINLTGNPGMACGGMGDALAGLIGGLIAQGLPAFDATCLGVYLHGRAGDRVAWSSSQAGMTTGDLIDEIAHPRSHEGRLQERRAEPSQSFRQHSSLMNRQVIWSQNDPDPVTYTAGCTFCRSKLCARVGDRGRENPNFEFGSIGKFQQCLEQRLFVHRRVNHRPLPHARQQPALPQTDAPE